MPPVKGFSAIKQQLPTWNYFTELSQERFNDHKKKRLFIYGESQVLAWQRPDLDERHLLAHMHLKELSNLNGGEIMRHAQKCINIILNGDDPWAVESIVDAINQVADIRQEIDDEEMINFTMSPETAETAKRRIQEIAQGLESCLIQALPLRRSAREMTRELLGGDDVNTMTFKSLPTMDKMDLLLSCARDELFHMMLEDLRRALEHPKEVHSGMEFIRDLSSEQIKILRSIESRLEDLVASNSDSAAFEVLCDHLLEINPDTLLRFFSLVDEYNWEWAIASFDWSA